MMLQRVSILRLRQQQQSTDREVNDATVKQYAARIHWLSEYFMLLFLWLYCHSDNMIMYYYWLPVKCTTTRIWYNAFVKQDVRCTWKWLAKTCSRLYLYLYEADVCSEKNSRFSFKFHSCSHSYIRRIPRYRDIYYIVHGKVLKSNEFIMFSV